MKYFILLLCLIAFNTFAQKNPTAFEIQRDKVNALLLQRSTKFGQYDKSLSTRTGIFGFQTKQDIRNSNEILREIALTDNEIFRELKVLLDYKDLQTREIEESAAANNARVQLYRTTIKKLQDQNALLTASNEKLQTKFNSKNILITLLLLSLAATGYMYYRRFKTVKKNSV